RRAARVALPALPPRAGRRAGPATGRLGPLRRPLPLLASIRRPIWQGSASSSRVAASWGQGRRRTDSARSNRRTHLEETALRVLVTGGSGFIGSHVLDVLVERGHKPVNFDRVQSPH